MPGSDFFKTVAFLSGLSASEYDLLGESAEEVAYQPGRSIVMRGMTLEGLYVVIEGSVSVWVKPKDAKLLQVATLGAGEVFGERSVVELGVSSATIKAEVPTRLYLIRQEAFARLMTDDHSRRQFIQDKIVERRKRLESNPEIERPGGPAA